MTLGESMNSNQPREHPELFAIYQIPEFRTVPSISLFLSVSANQLGKWCLIRWILSWKNENAMVGNE